MENFYFKKNIIFFVFGFLFLIMLSLNFFSAPKNFPKNYTITIKEGTSLRKLSFDLKKENIIKSRVFFESIVILYGGEKKILPGDYLFEDKINVWNVAYRISHSLRHINQIKITIPEGFDKNQMALLFSGKLKYFDSKSFVNLASEGYLFPDTYFLFPNSNEKDVIKIMSANFKEKISKFNQRILNSGRSEKEILTFASILEREAKGDADRAIISGILWNRIQKGMPLQVDAFPSTYKNKGLPKEPICSPGVEAIDAALNPVHSDYLFYLHDKTGVVHYARTFAEHKLNIQKYLK